MNGNAIKSRAFYSHFQISPSECETLVVSVETVNYNAVRQNLPSLSLLHYCSYIYLIQIGAEGYGGAKTP